MIYVSVQLCCIYKDLSFGLTSVGNLGHGVLFLCEQHLSFEEIFVPLFLCLFKSSCYNMLYVISIWHFVC